MELQESGSERVKMLRKDQKYLYLGISPEL